MSDYKYFKSEIVMNVFELDIAYFLNHPLLVEIDLAFKKLKLSAYFNWTLVFKKYLKALVH